MDNINQQKNLEEEFQYYLKNKDFFVKQYNGKYIAIKSKKVIYSSDTRKEVIDYMIKNNYELGSFLVQHVSANNSDTVQRYYSRIY
jgi:hypothetical protein